MMLQDVVFILIAFVTIAAALMAVWHRNVFYNAMSLILCLFGVACLFIYLNSEFLAILEVIIYIGAISVAIIFAIMLSETMYTKHETRSKAKLLRAVATGAALFLLLGRAFKNTTWKTASPEGDYSMREIGRMLLTNQLVAFEAVSLILLVAIIGALTILQLRKDA